MTTIDLPPMDGQSYVTGWRIDGQHCGQCGQPDNARDRIKFCNGLVVTEPQHTSCCLVFPCHGYVVSTPWEGKRTGREVWACCLGEAERRLGEPAVNWAGRKVSGRDGSPESLEAP